MQAKLSCGTSGALSQSIQLGASNGGVQLSNAWISDVTGRLPPGPARSAVTNALADGTLKIAVAGVNKQTGELVMVNVQRW